METAEDMFEFEIAAYEEYNDKKVASISTGEFLAGLYESDDEKDKEVKKTAAVAACDSCKLIQPRHHYFCLVDPIKEETIVLNNCRCCLNHCTSIV